VRLAIRAGHHVAFAHAAQLWQAERLLHVNAEPYLNHLTAAHLAEAAGHYYGLFHFIVTPLVLAWLYLRRPAAFGRLRSALVLATAAANAVFWAWPVAPPRFSVPGMTDILVTRDILGAAHPRGATGLVNLYAAMPSLHVAWAAWCALAVVTASYGRGRHLAWLYLASHHAGRAGLGQPLPAGCGRRARPRGPGHGAPPGGTIVPGASPQDSTRMRTFG
jgi:hypothetical protein